MANSAVIGTLRALLSADIADYVSAMDKSAASTERFGKQLTQAGQTFAEAGIKMSGLKTLIADFSGVFDIQKAEQYAAAVAKIGGASKLTGDDQARVNKVMSEALGHYQALGQEAPAHLQALEQATRRVDNQTKTFGTSLREGFAGLGPEIAKTAAGMVTGLLSVQALEAGFHELTAFVGDCIESFQKQELASKHVEAALRSTGTFTPQLVKQYDDLASQFEQTTVNADELNSEAIAMFTSMGEVGPAQMEKALQGASDLSAGLGIDLMSAVELISKGMTGSAERLKKLTGEFETSADKGQLLDNMLGAINARFGGRAAADVETTSGQIKKLGNEWDNVKEKIGGLIIQNPQVQQALLIMNRALDEQKISADEAAKAWDHYLISRMKAGTAPVSGHGQDVSLPVALPTPDAAEKLTAAMKKLDDAIKNLPATTKAAIIAGDAHGKSTKDLSDALKVEVDIVHGVVEAHKQSVEAAKKAAAAQADYDKQLTAMADVLTGAKVQAELDKLSAAVIKAGGAEKITTAEGEKLVKQLQDMQTAGGRLTPTLQTVIDRFQNWNTAGIKAQSGLGGILKLLPDVTRATEADAEAWLKQEAAWRKAFGSLAGLDPALAKVIAGGQATTKVDLKGWGEDSAVSADELGRSLSGLANEMVQLAQIGGAGWGDIAHGVAGTVVAINAAYDAISKLSGTSGFDAKKLAAISATWVGVAVAVAQVSMAIAAHVQQAHQIANAAKDIAREMSNTSIGNSLATGIAAAAEELKKLDSSLTSATARHYAELINLDKIIAEQGGLNSQNLALWASQAERLFEVVKRGGELGARASQELVTVIGLFAKQADSTGGVWDDTFKKLIADTAALGVGVDEIQQLIKGQQDKLVSGATGVTAAIGANAAKYTELKKAIEAAQKAGDNDTAAQKQAELSKVVVTTQGEFDRLSRIELGAFNTLVASGASSVDAMNQVGGGIDALIANADAFGLSGNAAFEELKRWRTLTTEQAPLLSSIGSLNDLMVASANLGTLSADSFADMQAQGVSALNQLQAAFTPVNASEEQARQARIEAETAEKPFLESVIKLHNEKHLALDAETEAIIEQAKQDGVLSGQQITTNDILLGIAQELATAFGVDLPANLKTFADAGKDAADKVSGKDGLGKVVDALTGANGLSDKIDDGSEEWKIWKKNALEQMDAAAKKADDTAGKIGTAFDKLDITIPVNFDVNSPDWTGYPHGDTGDQPDWPSAAHEGFFMRPMLAMVGDAPGERGEYVLHASTVDKLIAHARAGLTRSAARHMNLAAEFAANLPARSPIDLSSLSSMGSLAASHAWADPAAPPTSGTMTVILERDGRAEGRWLLPHIVGEVRRLQLSR